MSSESRTATSCCGGSAAARPRLELIISRSLALSLSRSLYLYLYLDLYLYLYLYVYLSAPHTYPHTTPLEASKTILLRTAKSVCSSEEDGATPCKGTDSLDAELSST